MADIWLLCKKENGELTAVGADVSEQAAKDLARDGDYVAIPVSFGKHYENIVDENMVGAVSFSNVSLYTLMKKAEAQLEVIDGRLDTVEGQGQELQDAVDAMEARVTALEAG